MTLGRPFAHKLRVRYAECDLQGIVFNAHYLAYFDTSITELWRAAFGGYRTMLERGIDIVLVHVELDFHLSARFDDELTLEVELGSLGNTSVITAHRISRDGELLVDGSLTHVFVDRQALTKVAIPGWAREGLTTHDKPPR